jgi:hypothetical protein
MTSSPITSWRPLRILLTALVAALALAPLVSPAQAAAPSYDIPDDISIPAGQKLFLVGHAVGVQIYTCNFVNGAYAWSAATPRADLYDDAGKVIVKHYGGPSWRAKDGSTFVGKRDKGVVMDTSAIAWLLLSKVSATAGPDGDRLAGTTFIHRINTTGGLVPPASDCNAVTATTTSEVDYTADYLFYKKLGI